MTILNEEVPPIKWNERKLQTNKFMIYSGIIIVRGGSMFVDFMGHPYPRINVPTNMFYFPFNLYEYHVIHIIYQLPTKLHPNKPAKIWLPTNIGPHELK